MSFSMVRNPANRLNAVLTVAIALSMGFLYSVPARGHVNLLPYAQDDFYYYLVVARNLVKGFGSTFDGTTATNGYHPLYLLLLWAVSYFAKSLRSVFWFLALLDTVSAVGIFIGARAFFARTSLNIWWCNALAILSLMIFRAVLYEQMEVTLTIPFAILFLLLLQRPQKELSLVSYLGVGFVSAVLVLTRLDAALLVFLCGVFALVDSEFRRFLTSSKIAYFLAGLLPPLSVYLAINHHFFHRFMPISGAAKQLEVVHGFHRNVLLHSLTPDMRIAFVVLALGVIALPFLWKKLPIEQRAVYTAALLFPFVHWGINLWLSDWPLWPWYTYSIRIAILTLLALFAILYARYAGDRWKSAGKVSVVVLFCALLFTNHYKIGSNMLDTANAASAVQKFAAEHPGRYAMGDRAGMVGYVNSQPTIQTEGLMMDAAYLEHVRRQDSLNAVFNLYKVDYYVAFEEKRGNGNYMRSDGCYVAKEPAQAGSQSPAMHGLFCQSPLMAYATPTGETRIFDLRQR